MVDVEQTWYRSFNTIVLYLRMCPGFGHANQNDYYIIDFLFPILKKLQPNALNNLIHCMISSAVTGSWCLGNAACSAFLDSSQPSAWKGRRSRKALDAIHYFILWRLLFLLFISLLASSSCLVSSGSSCIIYWSSYTLYRADYNCSYS